MREIKFRAWDKELEVMSNGVGGKDDKLFIHPDYDYGDVIFSVNDALHYSDYGLEWMQYTGLKDKNGVEVYEGDVVKYLTHTAHIFWSPQDFGFVHYNEVIGGYAGLNFFTGYKDFEVIGNIHQNPELLNA